MLTTNCQQSAQRPFRSGSASPTFHPMPVREMFHLIHIVDDHVDNFLAQQISQVPGVAQALIGGDQKPSIRVQVEPAKLAERPDAGGGARHLDLLHHDLGEGDRQYGANELHHRR